MKIITEVSAKDLETWGGATRHYEEIYNAGKINEFEIFIEEMYPNGIDQTQLNDILWFHWEELFQILGISIDED